MIANTDTLTLRSFAREAVSTKVSLISTDEHNGCRMLNREFPHAVRHGTGECVSGAVGTCHKVSAKYLQLAGFQQRYNNRHNTAIFSNALVRC